jgi:DNA-binding IscR family transcriptional regulator
MFEMKMSRTVEYAVQAMLQLAEHEPGVPIPCSRLAAAGQMPERFLLQILRNLVTHGILASTRGVEGGYTRGVEGGYTLERPADQISLLEVIEAIDGPLGGALTAVKGLPPETQQRLLAVLQKVSEQARRSLSEVKLADLLPVK